MRRQWDEVGTWICVESERTGHSRLQRGLTGTTRFFVVICPMFAPEFVVYRSPSRPRASSLTVPSPHLIV
jgi:hypothetical protein